MKDRYVVNQVEQDIRFSIDQHRELMEHTATTGKELRQSKNIPTMHSREYLM